MKGIVAIIFAFNVVLPAYGENNHPSGESKSFDYSSAIMLAVIATGVGVVVGGASKLLGSGAESKVLQQVKISLIPVNETLVKIEDKYSKIDQALQDFKLTLYSIQNQQVADRTLLKTELDNASNRLEERIRVIREYQTNLDRDLAQLKADFARIQVLVAGKLSNSKGGDAE